MCPWVRTGFSSFEFLVFSSLSLTGGFLGLFTHITFPLPVPWVISVHFPHLSSPCKHPDYGATLLATPVKVSSGSLFTNPEFLSFLGSGQDVKRYCPLFSPDVLFGSVRLCSWFSPLHPLTPFPLSCWRIHLSATSSASQVQEILPPQPPE